MNGFASHVVLDVDGLGPTRFVHGSPRSDEECVTPRTPADRCGVHGRRRGARRRDGARARLLRPAVGDAAPYRPRQRRPPRTRASAVRAGRSSARTSSCGRTDYDHEATAELYRASGIPLVEDDLQMLLTDRRARSSPTPKSASSPADPVRPPPAEARRTAAERDLQALRTRLPSLGLTGPVSRQHSAGDACARATLLHPESFEEQLGDRVTKRLKSPRAHVLRPL